MIYYRNEVTGCQAGLLSTVSLKGIVHHIEEILGRPEAVSAEQVELHVSSTGPAGSEPYVLGTS